MLLFGLWAPSAFANAALDFGCTATVFIMPGMTDDRKALLVTNGHCTGMGDYKWDGRNFPSPGEFFIDRDLQAHEKSMLTIFKEGSQDGKRFGIEKIVFATLTGSDLAVIEINATYRDLRSLGYRIFDIAKSLPANGTKLLLHSYFLDYHGVCTVDHLVPALVEGPYEWNNVIRMKLSDGCRVYPGVSGSPGIIEGSNTIYAIANTEFTGLGKDCGIMDPCEKDMATGTLKQGAVQQSYAIPTAPLNGCYDGASARFNFTLRGCMLVKK
jgi:hypothetical protein